MHGERPERLEQVRNRVRALYDELLASGGRTKKRGGLSPRSVQYAGTVLGKVMAQALALGYIACNPVPLVKRPTPKPPEMKAWTAAETAKFLAHARDDRLYAAWLLFLTRGARRGRGGRAALV
jgi:integrase